VREREAAWMLADQPIDVMLLATDLGVAKEFYAGKVGLES
jgi:hypothetical protein